MTQSDLTIQINAITDKIKRLTTTNTISVRPQRGDNYQYLQDTIDNALSQGVKNIYFHPGHYQVTKQLQVNQPGKFATLNLIGDACGHFSDMSREAIIEGQGVNFQNVRSCKLSGLVFMGAGKTDFTNQYAPYSAISVDYYNRGTGGSSAILIDECRVMGYEVGFVASPNAVSLNAENIHLANCSIDNCHIAYASTHWQGKANTVRNLICWDNTDIVFDGRTYGQQLGLMPWIYGANIAGGVKQVFNYGYQQHPTAAYNVFAELLDRIGDISGGAGTVKICDSNFDFNHVFPPSHFTGEKVVFDNCTIRYYDDKFDKRVIVEGVNNQFNNCYSDLPFLSAPRSLDENNRTNYYHNHQLGSGYIAQTETISADTLEDLIWLDVLTIDVENKKVTGRDINLCKEGDWLTRGHPFFPFARVMKVNANDLDIDYINREIITNPYHVYAQRLKT